MKFDAKKLSLYPQSPGVYLMKTRAGTILYIGKAINLRNRVKQYFMSSSDGRWIIPFLQEQVEEIETVVTSSEKEALLLENILIKKHKPRYNALLKDDKTYIALMLNDEHPWPRLSLLRYKGKPTEEGTYFGPYTSAYDARKTLELLQRLYPLRQCSDQELQRRTRPCILYGMKRCSAPCVGLVTKEKYHEYVDSTIQFLRGNSDHVLDDLKNQMEAASEALDFERASSLLQAIRGVEKTLEKQNIEKASRGLSGDVIALFRQGDEVILSQLIFQEGKLNGFKHHNFSHILENDAELLESFLIQHYHDKVPLPKEVLLPFALENIDVLQDILPLKLSFPQKGERRRLIEMAEKNAEAAFIQQKDEKAIREKALGELQEKLRLPHFPSRIECIDTSHLSGDQAVSSLVTFIEGVPNKNFYRRYLLKQTQAGDDYGALREVLTRRFQKAQEEDSLPQLLIIDGGKGHLNAALHILSSLNVAAVDVIGVAKEEGKHTRGATQEQIFLPNIKDPIYLPPHSQMLFLLQRIRDEAHRFAINYQVKRRTKTTIRSSLIDIPGIGPIKQKALLKTLGSVAKIKAASDDDLLKVKGVTKKDVEEIRKKFHS